ncbi:protein-L-isoaspartate O-methyltransferase [Pseudolysobacter antarcticus]|uniref:Protein-L-isoaspartate O-methyltransferase n=1 Tax=Pseudolysobacter antarcticus TaxID=2511995 RepID=A0A411HFF7_9GAMM|nr:protein-L-isoaspartate O-methyltransferase [Pseudolysobacter antarcticus]QBB69220.1 protein-L-isoaspartate O-methyltransferase [Pseudolysobacter antarcticus]
MSMNIELARFNMVEQQVRPWEVLDARVLAVLAAMKREDYVAPEHRNLAFADLCLPLAHGEVMLKPVLEGRLLQALALTGNESVLEIGTGSGFVTACLAMLADSVVSIEQHADLAATARARLEQQGIANVSIETAEAVLGFDPQRQFDAVVVTGAVATVPQRFRDWVKPGGRLFAIVGQSPVQQAMLYTRIDAQQWSEESLLETDIPYLTNAAPPKRFTL